MPALALIALSALHGCCGSQYGSSALDLEWVGAFGYTAEDIVSSDIGDFGFLHVPVTVAGTDPRLMFDTGNMVGVTISSDL